jgi:hypothetical protein
VAMEIRGQLDPGLSVGCVSVIIMTCPAFKLACCDTVCRRRHGVGAYSDASGQVYIVLIDSILVCLSIFVLAFLR